MSNDIASRRDSDCGIVRNNFLGRTFAIAMHRKCQRGGEKLCIADLQGTGVSLLFSQVLMLESEGMMFSDRVHQGTKRYSSIVSERVTYRDNAVEASSRGFSPFSRETTRGGLKIGPNGGEGGVVVA